MFRSTSRLDRRPSCSPPSSSSSSPSSSRRAVDATAAAASMASSGPLTKPLSFVVFVFASSSPCPWLGVPAASAALISTWNPAASSSLESSPNAAAVATIVPLFLSSSLSPVGSCDVAPTALLLPFVSAPIDGCDKARAANWSTLSFRSSREEVLSPPAALPPPLALCPSAPSPSSSMLFARAAAIPRSVMECPLRSMLPVFADASDMVSSDWSCGTAFSSIASLRARRTECEIDRSSSWGASSSSPCLWMLPSSLPSLSPSCCADGKSVMSKPFSPRSLSDEASPPETSDMASPRPWPSPSPSDDAAL
mmetsp:Transcript_8590/g.15732  ORF Transcript_8590/g.15732 Transcript_8590/m.15732 type:complete len:309 (-) Transcript_8590:12-938(-)